MGESLSDMLKQHEALGHQKQVLEAMVRIVERTPGATDLEDAGRRTGRSWIDLLVEETGLTPEQVQQAATALSSDGG